MPSRRRVLTRLGRRAANKITAIRRPPEARVTTWAGPFFAMECAGTAKSSLLVLWAHRVRLPNYAEATKLADSYGEMAGRIGHRGAIATANYMRGVTYHHTGRLLEAEGHFELSLRHEDETSRQAMIERFGYDRKVDAMSVLANLQWLRGHPDHALRLNRRAIVRSAPIRPRCAVVRSAHLGKLHDVSSGSG
jgi:hypothetical protein